MVVERGLRMHNIIGCKNTEMCMGRWMYGVSLKDRKKIKARNMLEAESVLNVIRTKGTFLWLR